MNRRLELQTPPIEELVVAPPRRPTRDMSLSYVSPTLENAIPVACLQWLEVESEIDKWKNDIL